jgi:protein-tyrosine phosphatase
MNVSKNRKTLVHCKGGINRSTAVVIAYLCAYSNMEIKEARAVVSAVRPQARFQPHYMGQVLAWLQARPGYVDMSQFGPPPPK